MAHSLVDVIGQVLPGLVGWVSSGHSAQACQAMAVLRREKGLRLRGWPARSWRAYDAFPPSSAWSFAALLSDQRLARAEWCFMQIGCGPRIDFALPDIQENAAGRLRTVGVEVEFGAISARQAATALAEGFGGTLTEEDAHALIVGGTALGDLMVEIDTRYAHPQRHSGTRWGRLSRASAARLGTALHYVVPRELVTRPLPLDRLALADRAVQVLRLAGARETGPVAFGLHFNPEPPRLDAETITAILKAFMLLNDWLRRECRPRRLTHRIGVGRDYPPAYVRRVIAPDYWPDLDVLMDEYLVANPTRNRDLDLLPLFLHADSDEAGHAFQDEAGHLFRFHSGRRSDLKPATS